MTASVLLMAVERGAQLQQIKTTFGVDWPHLLSQIVSFCIVCFLLQKYAYKPVLKMLQDRRAQIAEGLANTKKIEAELAQTEAQRKEILLQADAQATKLIEEARAAAARVREEETAKAIAAAEQIIAKSHEAAAQDCARMLLELKRDVGRLVVQTTATVTGKILTPEDQRRLAEETVDRLAA